MKNTNKSVKKRLTYGLLFWALMLPWALQAKVNNYIGLYVEAGEWSMMPSYNNSQQVSQPVSTELSTELHSTDDAPPSAQTKYKPSLGAAGGLGFLYELQAGRTYKPARFLLDLGVGVQGGWTSYMQSSDMKVVLPDQLDLDEDVFDYVYEVRNRHDQYTNIAVKVPLLFGFQYKRFYMLAGVKVLANIFTMTHITADMDTYGLYKHFDPFRNMPELQFFTDKPLSGGSKTSLNLDVDASFEIGGRIGMLTDETGFDVPQRNVEYRLAAFVDYGLLDLHNSRSLKGFTAPDSYNAEAAYKTTTMIDNLTVNDIMSTQGFADKVNNLMVGIKFTVLFRLPEPGQCVICRDAYLPNYKSGRGGVKYEE